MADSGLAVGGGTTPVATTPPAPAERPMFQGIWRFFSKVFNTVEDVVDRGFSFVGNLVGIFLTFFARIFRLFPWGERNPLMTEGVLSYTHALTCMLIVMGVFEVYTWSASFGYALSSTLAVVALTSVMVVATLVVDRSLLVIDTRSREQVIAPPVAIGAPKPSFFLRLRNAWRSWRGLPAIAPTAKQTATAWQAHLGRYRSDPRFRHQVWQRFAILLMIAVVNTVPFELKIFESEIEHRIGGRETQLQEGIRARANATERTRADRLLTEEDARARDSLTRETADRVHARNDMLARETSELTRLRTEATRLGSEATRESAGTGPSGQRGAGGVYEALRRDTHDANERVGRYEREIRREREAFDAESAARRAELDRTSADRKAGIRRVSDTALARIASVAFLTEHRSEWEQPKGFLARFAALRLVEADSLAARVIVWGLRTFTVFLGLMFVLLKARAPREFETYHSVAAQAAAGNDLACTQLANLGVKDFVAHGLDVGAKGAQIEWHGLCSEATAAIQQLESFKQELASRKTAGDWYLRLEEVRGQLRTRSLETVEPIFRKMSGLAQYAHIEGMGMLAWPESLNSGIDPRVLSTSVWSVSADELTRLGWNDPSNDRAQVASWLEAYEGYQFSLLDAEARWRVRHHELTNANASAETIAEAGTRFYADRVLPAITELTRLEIALTKRSISLPSWPNGRDPREELSRSMMTVPTETIDERELIDVPAPAPATAEHTASPPPLPSSDAN